MAMLKKLKKKRAAKATLRRSKPASGSGTVRCSEVSMDTLKRFIRARGEGYLRDKNITSIGIGCKRSSADSAGTLALQFSVAEKVVPEALKSMGTHLIPREIEFEGVKIPTDVVQRSFRAGYIVSENLEKDVRKTRLDPVQAGASIGHVNSTAGTVGAIVLDKRTQDIALLSNWHVLHTARGRIGDLIAQPGPHDDNRTDRNLVGRLLRSHLGPAGDCAICSVEGRRADPRIMDLNTPVTRIGRPQLGDRVVKSGRTTGVTYGIVSRVETLTKIDYDGTQATVGGFEISVDPGRRPADGEISRPGDSGAAWLAALPKDRRGTAASDVMLGLHFAGETPYSDQEFAMACYADAVFEKLEIVPLPATARPAVRAQSIANREDLRRGYDQHFLDFELALPRFSSTVAEDLVCFRNGQEIPYCHFSVWLSKQRRLPRVVAWNIDGGAIRSLSRKELVFGKDTRERLEDYQLGDELYANNPLDRGHVARRADLCWGSLTEARQANFDSFYFTNITPQHASFNQGQRGGLWGLLENAIFEEVDVGQLRVSLMGGPILRASDAAYGDIALLPQDFWKIIGYRDAADGKPRLRAFILTQSDLIKGLRPQTLELADFRWYQVPLGRIERECGLVFDRAAHALDTMRASGQAVASGGAARLISSQLEFFQG